MQRLSISACLLALIAFAVLAQPSSANTKIAPWALLQQGIGTFTFSLTYHGPQDKDKPLCNLTLSVLPKAAVADIKHDPDGPDMYVQITEDQARKLIAISKDLGQNATLKDLPATDGYTQELRTDTVSFIKPLGFDLATLARLDEIRKDLDGQAAGKMDRLLQRLADKRKQWTSEGRVFTQAGLAVFIKPPQSVAPGKPIALDVCLQNVSDKAMTLSPDPRLVENWYVNLSGPADAAPADQTVYSVMRPGKAVMQVPGTPAKLTAGEKLAFTLTLSEYKYMAQPKVFPAKMVLIDSLPPAKHLLTPSIGLGQLPDAADSWRGQVTCAALELEAKDPTTSPSPSGGSR